MATESPTPATQSTPPSPVLSSCASAYRAILLVSRISASPVTLPRACRSAVSVCSAAAMTATRSTMAVRASTIDDPRREAAVGGCGAPMSGCRYGSRDAQQLRSCGIVRAGPYDDLQEPPSQGNRIFPDQHPPRVLARSAARCSEKPERVGDVPRRHHRRGQFSGPPPGLKRRGPKRGRSQQTRAQEHDGQHGLHEREPRGSSRCRGRPPRPTHRRDTRP